MVVVQINFIIMPFNFDIQMQGIILRKFKKLLMHGIFLYTLGSRDKKNYKLCVKGFLI